MKQMDPTVKKETCYIAVFVLLLSVLMQAVFLVCRKWELAVLLGNLLGATVAILNFLLMGLTVQTAIHKDEKDARLAIRTSMSLRMFMMFAAASLCFLLPCFHPLAGLLPLLFPRIAILFRPLVGKDDP